MKAVYIATGAANMYCGSCMRDNTLAAGMRAQGLDVTLLPLYTPMRLDEEDVGEKHIFVGGIEAYLLQQFPNPTPLRNFLLRAARSQTLLRMMPRFDFGSAVDPQKNAALTISMLRGNAGNQQSLIEEMVDWLAVDLKPTIVHITNTLLSGIAPELKRRLGTPIVCGLHGEDIFLQGLPEPYQRQALELIRENAAQIDHFIAISQYYADFYSQWVGLDRSKITLVRPGINLQDYPQALAPRPADRPLTIGYFARIAPEKGLHILAQAFAHLCAAGDFPDLRLKVGGYLSSAYAPYVDAVRTSLRKAGVLDRAEIIGTLDREQKIAFFRSIDVFSVPTVYRDPKGLPVLEAWASGVPVVQPDHGAFPELIAATGGGLLHIPEDALDLAGKLAQVLRDSELRQNLAQCGYQAVRQNFSAERMARDTIRVYEQLAAAG